MTLPNAKDQLPSVATSPFLCYSRIDQILCVLVWYEAQNIVLFLLMIESYEV